jgi:hypothetical protein
MAYSVDVRLNHSEIATFLYTPAGPIVPATRRLGQRVQRVAIRRAPKDTGRLASSITVVVGSAPGFVYADIGSKVPYALWRHEGTGIYGSGRPIRPRTASRLRFKPGKTPRPQTDGYRPARADRRGYVYARQVRGTPGVPYLVSALTDVMGGAARIRSFGRRGR